ncbi:CBS domain-containing protein [Neobacillus sp. PS3-40]|jgi:CBS domain-containing protein|uniref:CBS domain-containing protein n=1 Tax=Neobacillus sp. PS3-40 TaxID=3070679 RepID=UPI0027E0917D|nr:CBS domain-containing protein [Neobacillus sp. PS3-40]WML44323.1 CBS domain-containing protein [Neobacillus sp. PS3-40]
MKVKDFMIRSVITANESDSVEMILKKMAKYKIGGLPVVDAENQLKGIVTDGDVLRYLTPTEENMYIYWAYYVTGVPEIPETPEASVASKKGDHVKDFMKKKVATISEDDTLKSAIELLARHHFKKIPVLNEEMKVVGIISRGDIIRRLSEKFLTK